MRKLVEKYQSLSRGGRIALAIVLILAVLVLSTLVPYIAGHIQSVRLANELEDRLQNGNLNRCGFILRNDGEVQTVPELTDDQWEACFSDIEVKPLPHSYDWHQERKPFILSMDLHSPEEIGSNDKGYYHEIIDCRFLEGRSEFLIYYKLEIFLCTSGQVDEVVSKITWVE